MDNVVVTITSFFTGGSAPAAAPEPAPPPLPHPFDPQEEPLPLKQKLICAALSPLILIFAVVRGLLFAFLVIFYSGCSALAIHGLPPPDKSAGFFEPLRGFRRHLLRFAAYCVGRSILLTLGVWPGLLNVRGEWDPSCPVCIAAPHVGASDAFLFVTLGLPRPVILEPYSKICFVRQILQGCGALLVPIVSAGSKAQTEGKEKGSSSQTNAVRETILAHKRSFEPSSSTCCNDSAPITLFSEGITHAGCALLPFFPGAFEGGSSVQPIVVRYHFTHYNAQAFLTTLGSHFGRLLTVRARLHSRATTPLCSMSESSLRSLSLSQNPWMAITVDFLPVHQPTPEEERNGQLMAESVRQKMGVASGLPLHNLGARELRKEMKAAADAEKAREAAAKGANGGAKSTELV